MSKFYADLRGCSVSWVFPHWICARARPRHSRTYSTAQQRVEWLQSRLASLPVNARGEIDVPAVAVMMQSDGLYSPKTYRLDMQRSVRTALEAAQEA